MINSLYLNVGKISLGSFFMNLFLEILRASTSEPSRTFLCSSLAEPSRHNQARMRAERRVCSLNCSARSARL